MIEMKKILKIKELARRNKEILRRTQPMVVNQMNKQLRKYNSLKPNLPKPALHLNQWLTKPTP
jgi:hypothetical protein